MANLPVMGTLLVLLAGMPFVLSCHNANSSPGKEAFGDVTGDSAIKAGSNFEISCTLNTLNSMVKGRKETFNSSDITFEFNGRYFKRDAIRLINESTAMMEIKNASLEDSGFYYCYLDAGGNLSFVCSMHLEVGIPPRKIGQENFQCVSLHYESLNCSWNAPNYNTQTNYSLDLVLTESSSVGQSCPERYSNTACAWTAFSDPPYRPYVKTHVLILTSTNIWGSVKEKFYVNNNEMIIAPKVDKFQIETVKSSSVLLKWSPPEQMDLVRSDSTMSLPFLTYEIQVKRMSSHHNEGSLNYRSSHDRLSPLDTFILRTNDTSLNVTNLVPFNFYIFNLRCIVFEVLTVDKDHTPFWSPYTQVNTTTQPDVPSAPPRFNMVYESIRTHQGNRNVVLYWNPLNENDAFGPDFHYIITYVPILTTFDISRSKHNSHEESGMHVSTDDSNSSVIIKPLPLKSTSISTVHTNTSEASLQDVNSVVSIKIDQISLSSHTIDLISSSTAYSFKIYSANSLGISSNFSQIQIEMQSRLPPRPVSVEAFYYEKNKYEIRWSHPIGVDDNLNITAYVISHCVSAKPTIEKCTGPLMSTELAFNDTRETATTLVVDFDSNHHFAVTAKFSDGRYSPLSWASCVVPIGLKKLDKVPKVYAKVINDTAIRVSWKVTCTALTSVISKFELTYCESKRSPDYCVAESKNYKSIKNSTAREMIITDLKPATLYRFQLIAWAENTAGDESDVFFESTDSTPLSMTLLILAVVAIFIATVVIAAIFRCLYSVYKILFSVYKTHVDLPSDFHTHSYDYDANVSSSTPSYQFPQRLLKHSGDISDHLSAQTLNSTLDGSHSEAFNASITGLLTTSGPSSDSHGPRKIKRLPDGMEESSFTNSIATIGGDIKDKDNENGILHYLNTNDGPKLSLDISCDSGGDLFSSSKYPLLYSSPDGHQIENHIYSKINGNTDINSLSRSENVPLIIKNLYENQTSLSDTSTSSAFANTQPSNSSSICSVTRPCVRTLVKQDSFDIESGYTTSPCLSKESSVESGKSKSNIAATSLTKKGYVPFIPQYLDSTAS